MLQPLTLKAMAERITKGAHSDQEKALQLFQYVHEHLFTPPRGKPAGDSILEVLVRNVAWCSRQSDILAMLARCVWIDGGYVTLYGYDDVSHHTVCVLKLDGRLRVFDPQNGFVFATRDGEIATLEQVRELGPKLQSAQYRAVKRFLGGGMPPYFRLYDPAHAWEIHVPSTPMALRYMDYVYDALGDPFLRWYQDRAFQLGSTDPFTRARMKQLVGRFDEALEDYDRIIQGEETANPPVLLVDYEPLTRKDLEAETRFFRGQTLFDLGDHQACVNDLRAYLQNHPDNRWRDLALYYLGESSRKLEKLETAATYFAAVRKEHLSGTPAPERLARILDTAWARPKGTE
jgi:tetratricopeptide (TPR) repeat protein